MENNFDAIVVGTGISGGWAAKELCEKGLKTLVLERGRMVNMLKIIKQRTMKIGNFQLEMLLLKKLKKDNLNKVEQDM